MAMMVRSYIHGRKRNTWYKFFGIERQRVFLAHSRWNLKDTFESWSESLADTWAKVQELLV
jgi:hypothetical protein